MILVNAFIGRYHADVVVRDFLPSNTKRRVHYYSWSLLPCYPMHFCKIFFYFRICLRTKAIRQNCCIGSCICSPYLFCAKKARRRHAPVCCCYCYIFIDCSSGNSHLSWQFQKTRDRFDLKKASVVVKSFIDVRIIVDVSFNIWIRHRWRRLHREDTFTEK